MTRAWLGIGGLVLLLAGGGCKGTPAPLPPAPANAGQVMLPPGTAPAARDGQVLVDRVVAVVNEEVVMMSELDEAVFLYQQDRRGAMPPGGRDELRQQVLGRMIEHRLQIQAARREKIEVADDEVQVEMDNFIKRNGGDREALGERIRAQGLSWDGLRRIMRDDLMAQRVRARRVSRRATITEAEVDAYMATNRPKLEAGLKYHARHIAVLAEPADQPAAWARAQAAIEAIAAQLAAGADFATLARERSQDPSARSGGDLEWLARGELDPLFETPLLALDKGGVTAPIKSAAGYHLFKLEEREQLTPTALLESRQQARELLQQKKAMERYQEWLDDLRRRALIAIRL
jgi:peptidyl-prolyl cis-trans isomerase SurA